MAFDSDRGLCVLTIIGPTQTPTGMETWEWNGTTWSPRLPANSPFPRTDHAMAYDAARRVVVLFAGLQPPAAGGVWRDTQEWDGTDWRMVSQNDGPAGRVGHGLVYDVARGKTILFGGLDPSNGGSIYYGDTWEYNGTAWRQLSPVSAPSPRTEHAMCWDPGRSRIVLFGGKTATTSLDDTWEWDGTTWMRRFPATRPAARFGHAMTCDSVVGRTILFGGQRPAGPTAETWHWDGTEWAEQSPVAMPPERHGHALVYDASRSVSVLFGGDNGQFMRDTWEYTPGRPGTYTTFGAGCPGSRGTPSLSNPSANLPTPGRAFSVQLNNLPLTGPAFMFTGASNTFYGALPLPFDMTVIGMTGCSLLVSGDVLTAVTNVLGVGLWTINIPAGMAGVRFYNQGIVFDPPANPLGLTLTNAAAGFVGG